MSVTALLLQLLHRPRVVLTALGYSENDKIMTKYGRKDNLLCEIISKFQVSRGYLREEVGTKAYKALHI